MYVNGSIRNVDVTRNLDLAAIRSFVTVAEAGGVTRAAGLLNLTQSAVSMQLKRLEESLDLALMDRSGRTIGLTAAGEQLLGYGRRLLALNDEIYTRLTAQDYEGELRLGVPHDIIYPSIPQVLKRFSADFPRMRVHLISAPSLKLKAMFARGDCDVILTTEDAPDAGGEALVELPLLWVGARGGTIWRTRPLRLALCSNCTFRPGIIRRVEDAGMDWEMVVDSAMDSAAEAAVSADLAVLVAIKGGLPRDTEVIAHGGALPDLGTSQIILYTQGGGAVIAALAELIRSIYAAKRTAPSDAVMA